jgi:DNA repair exonuclease SbcCD nuclease subunit
MGKIFRGFIASGHYHKHMLSGTTLAAKHCSPGSLTQLDFGDEGMDRGITFLNGSGFNFCPIESPRFMTLVVKGSWSISKPKGNFIRVRGSDIKKLEKAKEYLIKAGAASVVVELEREFQKAKTETIKISTPSQMISDYIDLMPSMKPKKKELMEEYEAIMS